MRAGVASTWLSDSCVRPQQRGADWRAMTAANPYAVLGVPEDASAAEIKKAYRRQMRLAAVDIHPDVSDAEREVLQQRMIEVNRAFEVLSGPGRQVMDAELRRQRASDVRREQELRREQAERQAAWQAAQRRASEASERARGAQALREAAVERERLQRVRRQAQEHARRTRQRQGEDARRYQEAAWVREYVDERPGYRYQGRVGGPAATPEFLDALWDLLAPRAGQDVHETIELTREEWASGVVWTSGVDGLPLPGLEHSPPATYRFPGRGAQGVYGGTRGDHYVTVVHVDDLGRVVVGGFGAPGTDQAVVHSSATPRPGRDAPTPLRRGALGGAASAIRRVATVVKWVLVAWAGLLVALVLFAVVLVVVATRN